MCSVLPLLCECTKQNGFVQHRDVSFSYVLWVLPDGIHVVFINMHLMMNNFTCHGVTFEGLLAVKQGLLEEPCKMISRPFVKSLGYKPDYVVITDSHDEVPDCKTTCGYTMHTFLQLCSKNPNMEHIRTLAEGPGEPSGQKNQLGQLLTTLSSRLEARGFMSDPKYFPNAQRDLKHIANGMPLNELKLRRLLKRIY